MVEEGGECDGRLHAAAVSFPTTPCVLPTECPLEPFSPEAGPSRTRSLQNAALYQASQSFGRLASPSSVLEEGESGTGGCWLLRSACRLRICNDETMTTEKFNGIIDEYDTLLEGCEGLPEYIRKRVRAHTAVQRMRHM